MAFSRTTLIRSALIRCYDTLRGENNLKEPLTHRPPHIVAVPDKLTVCLLLTPTEVMDESSVELVSEQVYNRTSQLLEPQNFLAEVCGVFEELAMNAVQHSDSLLQNEPEISSFPHCPLVMIDRYVLDGRNLFAVGVRDFGIGLPKAMHANKPWAYEDKRATTLAFKMGRTGTREVRGMGSPHIADLTTNYDGCLVVAAGGHLSKGSMGIHGSRSVANTISRMNIARMTGTFTFAALFSPEVSG